MKSAHSCGAYLKVASLISKTKIIRQYFAHLRRTVKYRDNYVVLRQLNLKFGCLEV